MSLLDKASIVWPKGAPSKAGNLAAWNPQGQSLVEFDVVRATTATRVNEAGLIESVAANVIRRDFLNGGCGDYLIEPQRTNLLTYSEDFTNIIWGGTNRNITVSGTAPDGGSANLLEGAGTATFVRLETAVTLTVDSYSISVFAKQGSERYIALGISGISGNNRVYFDLQDGVITSGTGTIEDYGNGWYRCTTPITATGPDVDGSVNIWTSPDGLTNLYPSNADTNGKNILIWGAQLEKSSYSSSYIPTTTSSVTRNADVPALTGASALLGDSAGGLYLKGSVFDGSNPNIIEISNSVDAANERVLLEIDSTNITGKTTDGGVEQATINAAGSVDDTEFEVCYNYALNSFSLQKDGATAGTDSSGTTPSGLDQVRFTDGTNSFYGRLSELIIFNQRPTDAQGEALTA